MQLANFESSTELEYPSLSDRVQSSFIDTIFIVALMFASASILEKYQNPPDWIRIALFFGFWAIYEPLCTTFGFTTDNFLKGIRIRKMSDPTKRLNLLQAIVRYVFKIALGWLSFITVHMNPQRRAIHDFVSGSIVIKHNRS